MNHRTNIRHILCRSMIIGCLSCSMSLSGMTAAFVYAGPADELISAAPAPGPASESSPGTSSAGPGSEASAQTSQAADLSYYNQVLADPIVNPVDKYSYEQMEQDLMALSSRYPGKVSVNSIGQSLDGRNIYDVVIGNPQAPKKLLIQGAIHAREYIVVPLMMQQMEYLLAGYDSGTYQNIPLSSVLSQVAIHFVPMVNPDGVAISQLGESGLHSEELRAGLQAIYAMDTAAGRTSLDYGQYLTRWKANARGVDLNYNFDAKWAEINPGQVCGSSNGYKGVSPLSEPESQALAALIQQTGFSATISYHAMGRVLYWDTEGNQKAAESYDMAVTAGSVTGYSVLSSHGVGGMKDWAQKALAIPGITIEVGRSICPVAFSEYPAIWEQNKAIPALFAQYVLTH